MKVVRYIFQHKLLMISIVSIMIIQTIFNFCIPYLTCDIINLGIAKGDLELVINQGLIMLAITIISAFIGYGRGILNTLMIQRIGKEIRSDLFKSIMTFSEKDINKFSESSLIVRSTNDVSYLQEVIRLVFQNIFNAPIVIAVGLFFAYKTIPELTWLILLVAIVILIAALILVKITAPIFQSMQNKIDEVNKITRENLSGILVSKAFNRSKFEFSKFEHANNNLFRTQFYIGKLMSIITPLLNLGFNGISVVLLFIGGFMVNSGNIGVGEIVAFTNYSIMIAGTFISLGMLIGSLPRANVIYVRIQHVLELGKRNANELLNNKTKINPNEKLLFQFKNVSFSYDNGETLSLENINFDISDGDTIGVIGDLGSGKSSLIKLLLRMYPCTTGEVLLNSKNINSYKLEDYRNLFAYTPQDSFLFKGTIKSNIKLANKTLNDEEIFNAIKLSQANDFIKTKKNINNKISQDSQNISGGQRQRLSIARTIASQKKIMIFDDCFSSVDYKTESKILQSIHNNFKDNTKIFISSRISTIASATKIVVLNQGKIVGIGKHKYLVKHCPEYLKIVKSQMDGDKNE